MVPLRLAIIGRLIAGRVEGAIDWIRECRLRTMIHTDPPEHVILVGEVLIDSPADDVFRARQARSRQVLTDTVADNVHAAIAAVAWAKRSCVVAGSVLEE